MNARRILLLSTLCLTVTAGCQTGRSRSSDAHAKPAHHAGLFAVDHLNADIQLPPGISHDLIAPLQGDQLSRAKWSLKKILATLDRPAYLDTSTGITTDEKPDEEPPLDAQLDYVQARTAWLKGNPTLAKQKLEAALRLTPNQPVILRLLGEVYTRTGNRIRGAQYFRQAVSLEPGNAPSVYILGRFAAEKADHDEAIVLFNDAIQKSDDPALTELSRHFLANALRGAGFVTAAIKQLDEYIQLAQQEPRPSDFARDQFLLRQQIGVTYQLIGDLNLKMDRPGAALLAYDQALKADVPDIVKLDKRRIYAAMLGRDAAQARQYVIDLLQRQRGDAQSLAMVRYAVDQGIDPNALADTIRSIYDSQGQPSAMAIAAADVLPPDAAQALLTEHLDTHPDDREVYRKLLRDYLLPIDQAPHSEASLAQAVDITARLMAEAPALADAYGSIFVNETPDKEALIDVLDASNGPNPQMRTVLKGLCLALLNRLDEALTQFESALQQDPSLAVARIEEAKVLIVQNKFDQAAEALAPLKQTQDTGVILLRARVLAETDQAEQAVDLLDGVIRRGDADPRLVIAKANLQIRLGRVEDAEQSLLDALNAEPDSEPLYEALLDLYDPEPGRRSLVKNQTAKWRVLVKRLLGTIPNSRTGRLVQAQLYDASRNYDHAIAILQGLLAENPDDAKAFTQLLDTFHAAGRNGEAIALLENRLETMPDSPALLQIAIRFYTQAGDQERLFDAQQRLLMLQPDTPARAIQLALLYNQWGKHQQVIDTLTPILAGEQVDKPLLVVNLMASALYELNQPDQAERLIREAADRFKDQQADLLYLLSLKLSEQGEDQRADQVMHNILKAHPDFGPANNGLGYAMLMRNENIEDALKMIQRAVDGEPDNPAYLDSLGWAYYKLGQYQDAEVWLTKAMQAAMAQFRESRGQSGSATLAVVNDHLGDAIYRQGPDRQTEAMRNWAQAGNYLRRVDPEDTKLDPELSSLRLRITNKITAIREKKPAPVAEVPGRPIEPESKPQPEAEPKPKLIPAIDKADDADVADKPADAAPESEPENAEKDDPEPAPSKPLPVR